jgi:hypothetical protein
MKIMRMKRNLLNLFVFILCPLVSNTSGNIKINKGKEWRALSVSTQKSVSVIPDSISDWTVALGTYYDPMDSCQTKKNPDGIGATGRKIKSGSIALGWAGADSLLKEGEKNGKKYFIQVKNLDIITPYGRGIFRVDDKMRIDSRFKNKDTFLIDFFHKDLNNKLKAMGYFNILFKFL